MSQSELASGVAAMSLPGIQTHGLTCVSFDRKGQFLIAGGGAMERRNGRSVTLRELMAWDLPNGEIRWQVVEPSEDRIADLAVSPNGKEIATKCTDRITIWSINGKVLRTFNSDFLAGPTVFSENGQQLVAPEGNIVKVRNSQTGKVVASVEIAKSTYTSAKAAVFLDGTSQLVVAACVINSKGQTSGKLLLVDCATQKVRKSSNLDLDPDLLAIDPCGSWVCIAGERRGRGCIMFWSLEKWGRLADQGAHGASVDCLATSPDGRHLASTGADHVIRLWDTNTFKTVTKLDQHSSEGTDSAGVAWSPEGKYIAFAAGGKPPEGGVYLYERVGENWQLNRPSRAGENGKETADSASDLRHLQIFGSDVTMDTVGNFNLPANRWPLKCLHCTLPEVDAVPEPYILSRGIVAPGDFSTAELGNFFVRERARQILEIAAPGVCRFYPTIASQSKKPTDWLLAVPQTSIPTASLPKKYVKCSVCGEPKEVRHLEPLAFVPPAVDIFKSRQWTCWRIGEETPWYLKSYLRTTTDKLPRHQWTRLGITRELWFSTRLLMLMKKCKLKGSYASALRNRKPTQAEAAWIESKLAQIGGARPVKAFGEVGASDAKVWLHAYLSQKMSAKPLATPDTVAEWERRNEIKLPKDYVDFVRTVGRHSFADMFGLEGYDVRIVGPRQLDAQGFRRDPPQDFSDVPEPDGLMFAVAVNGDCLCFDLRGQKENYAVYHFDHETTVFEPFAPNFAEAVRRLAEGV